MISACFYAQARIRKFTAKAACGPRSGQGEEITAGALQDQLRVAVRSRAAGREALPDYTQAPKGKNYAK